MRWLFGEYLYHFYFDGRPVVVLDEAAAVEPLVPINPLAFSTTGRRESRGR